MQAFEDIVLRLSDAQKIRLLTELSSLSTAELRSFGLADPGFLQLNLPNGDFAAPSVLARSFDPSFIEELTAARASGICHVELPSAKGAIGHISNSISEDPCLSASIANAYVDGVLSVGSLPYLDGYGYSTAEPSSRLIDEQLTAPFEKLLQKSTAVVADLGCDPTGTAVLRRKVSAENTVLAIARGDICISASSSALQKALFSYRSLAAKLEQGKLSASELDAAVKRGDAISDETVNAAVARVLALLAGRRAATEKSVASPEKYIDRAFNASSVLLLNKNSTLPLIKPTRLCILGDIAKLSKNSCEELSQTVTASGHSLVGIADGYILGRDRCDELLRPACELAATSDTVVLLLGADTTGRIGTLPPAQLALCRAMHRMRKRLIIVVSCDHAVDLGFIENMENRPSAILLAPLGQKDSLTRALEMLFGKRAPEGRLNETFADKKLSEMARNGIKTGPFAGYRFYDTIELGAIFPFGHGLSYTSFSYSHLTVSEAEISFKLKNTGKRRGVEIAQLYIGIERSTVLRPKKELVGFAKVELEPGESRTVTLPIKLPTIGGAIESGVYKLYVGSSVSNIHLTRRIDRSGSAILPDGESLCDYLPTHTNIKKDNYTLEAEHKKMRPTVRSLILGAAMLLLAAGVKIYDIITLQNSMFLNIVAIFLMVGAVVFFVLEILDRKKQRLLEQRSIDEANSALFENADRIPAVNADTLFVDAAPKKESIRESAAKNDERGYDYYADVNSTLDYRMSAAELSSFAAENGLTLSQKTAADIFSAFASSRIIIVKNMNRESFASLSYIIGNYFGSPAGIDRISEDYRTEADLIVGPSGVSELQSVISSAVIDKRNLHPAFFDEVTIAGLAEVFAPIAGYARSPFDSHAIRIPNGDLVALPNNVWFVLNLRAGEKLTELPEQFAETAAVIAPAVEISEKNSSISAPRNTFSFGQLIYLTDHAMTALALDEEIWKKLDQLESYAARHSEFSLGNKRVVGFETYLAVLSQADPEAADALDRALASKLVPSLIAALDGKLPRGEVSLAVKLDELFGEFGTSACRRMISNKN